MKVRKITEGEADLGGPIEQSFEWGRLQCSIPGRTGFEVFGVFESDEKILAHILVIRQVAGFGKTWLWAPRGPVFYTKDARQEIFEKLLEAVEVYSSKYGDVFFRIEPGEFGFEGGSAVPESYMPADTLVIDLDESEEKILAQMSQKGRYNIKIAHKAGVIVKEGGMDEMDDFYEILRETALRDGFHVHAKDFYMKFLKLKGARFYCAFLGSELIAGILVTYFNEVATYYFGASSNRHREAMAPYLLQWEAMRAAKAAGMREYDFLGIAPENSSAHKLAGVTQFKTRFGGKRVHYQEARCFVYRRFWWLVISAVKNLRRFF